MVASFLRNKGIKPHIQDFNSRKTLKDEEAGEKRGSRYSAAPVNVPAHNEEEDLFAPAPTTGNNMKTKKKKKKKTNVGRSQNMSLLLPTQAPALTPNKTAIPVPLTASDEF